MAIGAPRTAELCFRKPREQISAGRVFRERQAEFRSQARHQRRGEEGRKAALIRAEDMRERHGFDIGQQLAALDAIEQASGASRRAGRNGAQKIRGQLEGVAEFRTGALRETRQGRLGGGKGPGMGSEQGITHARIKAFRDFSFGGAVFK